MSLSVAPPAVRQGKQSGMALVVLTPVVLASDPSGRCSLRPVLSAARLPRYLLNPAVTDRCIAAIAIVQ
ncbi:MAG: hypothetical protein Q7K41_05870 [Dehalococcoidales bacterium]|nr:hypothetical protein [Dehalococcoidales bacterium]